MRVLSIAATVVFVLCVPVLLASASIWWAANSHWLYTSGFQRHGVAEATGFSEPELERIAAGLIDYFNSAEEFVSIAVDQGGGQPVELFTEEEVIHFRDVKRLFRLDRNIMLGTGAVVIAYAAVALLWQRPRHRRRLAGAVLAGGGLTLLLMLLLAAGVLLDFDRLFLQFHLLAFTNDFWSAEGYMLLLFPGGFWYDAAIRCAGATAGAAALLGGVAGVYLLSRRGAASPR